MAGRKRFVAKDFLSVDYKDFRQTESCFSEAFRSFTAWVFYLLIMEKYNNQRDEDKLIDLRPIIPLERNSLETDVECFQNQPLRPLLKMQHDLLLDVLLMQPNVDSILKYRERRNSFRDRLKLFLNQAQLKGMYIGIIVGLFSKEELKFYLDNSKECNKRILQMICDRLADAV